jgi:hypothetical protein
MDQRDEYWGNPIVHDPGEYNSPQHYDAVHHQQQQQHHISNPNYPPFLPSPDHTVVLPQHQLQHHSHHQRYDQLHLSSRNVTISAADVLCGRGKTSFNHGKSEAPKHYTLGPCLIFLTLSCLIFLLTFTLFAHTISEGNKSFRNAVSAALEDFVNAVNRFEKAIVVQRVVDMVVSRGGRFLKEDTRAGTWYQLSEQQSKEKVGHAIRDAANLYEVRKKKEQQMQQLTQQETNTPQLKTTGSDDDNNAKGSTWWTSHGIDESSAYGTTSSKEDRSTKPYRSSYTPTVDYSITSAAKRRSSVAPPQTTDYQPQRKRRRTYSPTPQQQHSYFQSTMALSDHIVSTPSPPKHNHPGTQQRDDVFMSTNLRRSPIVHPLTTSNIVSSGGSQKSSSAGAGGITTNVSSPIEPSSKPSKQSSQYYHRFTVYDPQQLPSSPSSISGHHQFHPETHDDVYTSPDEPPILPRQPLPPPPTHPNWSGGVGYPYGRSDFVRSSSSYDEQRHYPTPSHHPYRPPAYPSPAGIVLPAMGRQHHYQYPPQQQFYSHQLPIPSYGPPPSAYYPQQHRGSTFTTSQNTIDWSATATVTDNVDDNTVQQERQHGEEYNNEHDNNDDDDRNGGTNND